MDIPFSPLQKQEFVAIVITEDPGIFAFEFLEKFQGKGRRIIPGMDDMFNLSVLNSSIAFLTN